MIRKYMLVWHKTKNKHSHMAAHIHWRIAKSDTGYPKAVTLLNNKHINNGNACVKCYCQRSYRNID